MADGGNLKGALPEKNLQRIVLRGGKVRFFGVEYKHPHLVQRIGQIVILATKTLPASHGRKVDVSVKIGRNYMKLSAS